MQKALRVDEFQGLVNTVDPLRAPTGSMSVARNIDIDNQRAVHRRKGFTKVKDMTSLQSVYSTSDERTVYAIDDGNLIQIQPDFTHTVIDTGYPDGRYFFKEVGNKVYISGPKKVVLHAGEPRPWGIPTPFTPEVSVVPGSLPAGRYLVASVFRNKYGEEGGASLLKTIELDGSSALSIRPDIRANLSSVVYTSSLNSESLYKVGEIESGTVEFNGPLLNLVAPLAPEQINKFPVPEGARQIAYYNGSMHVATYDAAKGTSHIFWSQKFWLSLFDLFGDYLTVDGEVRMLENFPGGLAIGTSSGVYIYEEDRGLQKLVDYGVPDGYPATYSPEGVLYFWTKRGLCRLPEFANMTEAAVSVDPGTYCYTAFIEQDGYTRLLVSTSSGGIVNNRYSPGG